MYHSAEHDAGLQLIVPSSGLNRHALQCLVEYLYEMSQHKIHVRLPAQQAYIANVLYCTHVITIEYSWSESSNGLVARDLQLLCTENLYVVYEAIAREDHAWHKALIFREQEAQSDLQITIKTSHACSPAWFTHKGKLNNVNNTHLCQQECPGHKAEHTIMSVQFLLTSIQSRSTQEPYHSSDTAVSILKIVCKTWK